MQWTVRRYYKVGKGADYHSTFTKPDYQRESISLNKKDSIAMDCCCKLDGIEVRVVIGDELPDYEFRALQEVIKKVARRMAARLEKEAQEDMCLTAQVEPFT